MKISKKMLTSLVITLLSTSVALAESPDRQEPLGPAGSAHRPVQARHRKTVVPSYGQDTLQSTQYGMVRGIRDGEVLAWNGIPYGRAERWKAPEDPLPWKGIRNAEKSGPPAFQQTPLGYTGTEDCLTLDIYRPDTAETDLPVFFYIHGGNNQSGDSRQVRLQKLAVKVNAVAVSINFRLGAFGFNPLPALKHGSSEEDSGNYTILDILQALDWTKDNIRSFGGNPDNITAAGFSSGGRDVMALLISPAAKGRFQRAISFSGGMTTSDTADSQKIFVRHLAPYVVADGICSSKREAEDWLLKDSPKVAHYLRGLSAPRLAGAFGHAFIRMEAFPHLYRDGVVLPKEGFRTASYNRVPLLMFTGTGEFSLYARSDPYFSKAAADGTIFMDSKTKAEFLFARNYGSRMYELFNDEDSAARMSSHYGRTPVYTMVIGYGENPAMVGEKEALLSGAVHGIWIPFVTGYADATAKEFPPGSFDNPSALALADTIQRYIGNFMRTGNPNGKDLPLWKKWSSAPYGPTELVVDADRTGARYTQAYGHGTYETILKAMKADRTLDAKEKEYLIRHVLNGRWFSEPLEKQRSREDGRR